MLQLHISHRHFFPKTPFPKRVFDIQLVFELLDHLAEVGKFVAKTATEVHGGMGFTDLLGLHYWFKRIGYNRQLLGTPEHLREEAARAQQLTA